MGWWFGRKAAVEAARPVVPGWLSAASQEGFARSYEAQFDEVYRNNPVGQRSVRLVAGLLGSLSVYAAEGEPKAAALVAADGLIESIGAALLLHGNAYVQLLINCSATAALPGWPRARIWRWRAANLSISAKRQRSPRAVSCCRAFSAAAAPPARVAPTRS